MSRKCLNPITVCLFCVGSMFLSNCDNKKSEDPVVQKVENILDSLLLNPEFESVSVGIVNNGKIYKIYKGSLLNGESPTDQTLYEIASLTKTFTGTLLAQAIVDREVTLDDDIRQYLPDSFPNLAYNKHPITFRHLVTHQSGLPNMFPNDPTIFESQNWDIIPFEINKVQAHFSKTQFFEELQKVQLDTLPGLKFNYSNAGANLLGYILEQVYQQPFEELLKKELLIPLKMTHTGIDAKMIDQSKLAEGQNNHKIKMPFRVQKEMNAEGGIVSNVEDMTKYLLFHLDTSQAVITTAHQELWNGQYGDFEAGLFWQIFKDGDKPDKLFQNGGAFGTSSWITLIPELQTGIFIVTNVAGPDVHQKLNGTVEKILMELNPG